MSASTSLRPFLQASRHPTPATSADNRCWRQVSALRARPLRAAAAQEAAALSWAFFSAHLGSTAAPAAAASGRSRRHGRPLKDAL
eukprot:364198-Chlamydomonas_euryale.AAC.18